MVFIPITSSGWLRIGPRRWAVRELHERRWRRDRRRADAQRQRPHEEMDRRAVACFDQALIDASLARDERSGGCFMTITWATTTTMSRYHRSADDVPDGLRIRTGHGMASSASRALTR